ncbi:hemerythrin domain-containing protein [Flavihumibacter profundi]|jgi:iron-sulfur cluster repair protein YtfE (RIC family)|uniref:hemerythrin domain-containing protein n=1 Tax=Flavihumibacter profundi TaxID=2716883 RepID=UPI001CC5FFF8|nr:hemerythrin domain-containing protein [Flavihumibacter profundi]MBZ5856241.1 hemerythrin domain-containing protein [Flavihumibacter profundi]
MQRAETLQPLSRQHKAALMTCLLIRKGISKQASVAVMADFFLKSWEKDLLPHIEEEERLLVPLLNRYPEGKTFAATILRDHELLRNGIEHLKQQNLNERLIGSLADQLEQHIRFEERIVFQQMQDFIPEKELNHILFKEDKSQPVCNSYTNHFWE